jgi:hypothetical protein
MQKLDSKGNPIHSTMSSNDPTSPAIDTPQYYQQQQELMMKQGGPDHMALPFDALGENYLLLSEDDLGASYPRPSLTPQGSSSSERSYVDVDAPNRHSLGQTSSASERSSFADLTDAADDFSPAMGNNSSGRDCYHSQRAVYVGEDHHHNYKHPQAVLHGYSHSPMEGRSHRAQPSSSSRFVPPHPLEHKYGGGGAKEFDRVSAITNHMGHMDIAPYMPRAGREVSGPHRSQVPHHHHQQQQQWHGIPRPNAEPPHTAPQSYHYQQQRQQEYNHQPQHFAQPPRHRSGGYQGADSRHQLPDRGESLQGYGQGYIFEGADRQRGNGSWPAPPSSSYVPNLAAPAWEPSSSRAVHSASPSRQHTRTQLHQQQSSSSSLNFSQQSTNTSDDVTLEYF